MKLAEEILNMPLGRSEVKGILSGDEQNWSFQCLNREFLNLFPEGILCSFTYLGLGNKHYEHRRFQIALATRVQELLMLRSEKGLAASRLNARVGAKRYAIPRCL
ncbi:MAG: hypothetical protein JST06_08055 [Bacteroidetes bacterium]|nr:hypothetical protein [Bacteroidota bacterium]MBS1630725.1 hypothetical protein [Bacteroidota bacterium]